jgi:hypothetical protein
MELRRLAGAVAVVLPVAAGDWLELLPLLAEAESLVRNELQKESFRLLLAAAAALPFVLQAVRLASSVAVVPPVVRLLVVPLVPVAMQAVVERQAQGLPVTLEAVPLVVPGFPQEFAGLPVVAMQRNQIRKRLSEFVLLLLASFQEVR